jgi:hypothetical protein
MVATAPLLLVPVILIGGYLGTTMVMRDETRRARIDAAFDPDGALRCGQLDNARRDRLSVVDPLIAGAGLDVFEHGHEVNPRLRELPNVVLLPHMGSATIEGRIEMGEKVILNIKTFADGHRPPDQVVPGML